MAQRLEAIDATEQASGKFAAANSATNRNSSKHKNLLRAKHLSHDAQFNLQDYQQHETVLQEEE